MSIKRKKRAAGRPRRGDYQISATGRAVRRRWRLVLCVALLFSSLVAAFYAVSGPGYTAKSLVAIRGLNETGAGGVPADRLEEIRADAGAEKVSRIAMESLGWESGIAEFNRNLELDTRDGELEISFSAETPERAARAADAYAAAFVGRVESLSEDRLAGGALDVRAEISRTAEAEEAKAPRVSNLQTPYVALLAFIPGLIVGGGITLIVGDRDPRWRDARDAEVALGAPVLGVIPEREPAREEDGVVRKP